MIKQSVDDSSIVKINRNDLLTLDILDDYDSRCEESQFSIDIKYLAFSINTSFHMYKSIIIKICKTIICIT